MSVQRVEDLALEQVEDLERRVARTRQQIVPAWVERDRVDRLCVASVVLDEFVGANVPNFYGRVCRTRCNECRARVKGYRVNEACVLVECVDALAGVFVP